MFKTILTIVGIALIVRPAVGAEVYAVPPPIQQALKQVLKIADQTYTMGRHQRKQIDALGKSFDAALDNLANLSRPEWVDQAKIQEGEGIAPKIILIAADRKTRPAFYTKLEERYIHSVDNPMSRAPVSPSLQSAHLSEEYRLAWEYLLLRPPSKGAASQYELRALKALRQIGHPASIVVLTHNYQMTTHKDVVLTRYVSRRQRFLLSTLGQMPGQNTLDAIIQCLSLSDIQRQKALIIDTHWNPEQYAYRLFTDQVNYGLDEQWRKIILEAPVKKFLNKTRLLNSVKQYWQKRPPAKTKTGK